MGTEAKNIIIFGASGGVGESLLETAVQMGFRVIGTGSSEASAAKIAARFGEDVLSYKLDLADEKNVEDFIDHVKQTLGSLNWLINSAGHIDPQEPSRSLSASSIRKTFTINVESAARIISELTPLIREDGGVINISSTAGIWGNSDYPVYSASKAALNIFTRSHAKAVANTGQKVIAICPGPTNTKMRERIAGDASRHQSPNAIASVAENLILAKSEYRNGDIVIVRDGTPSIYSRIEG